MSDKDKIEGGYNVVAEHHKKNWAPKPPTASQLRAIRGSSPDHDSGSDNGSDKEELGGSSDEESSSSSDDKASGGLRAKRNTKGTKKKKWTQLQAYPGQWRTVLEDAKCRLRLSVATQKREGEGFGFPDRPVALSEAGDCLAEAMAEHDDDDGVVEEGTCLHR